MMVYSGSHNGSRLIYRADTTAPAHCVVCQIISRTDSIDIIFSKLNLSLLKLAPTCPGLHFQEEIYAEWVEDDKCVIYVI